GVSLGSVTGTATVSFSSLTGNATRGLTVNGAATLNLSDLTITGNGSGASLTTVTTLNFTATTGNVTDYVTLGANSIQLTRDPLGANVVNQVMSLSGVTTINVFGGGGTDTLIGQNAASVWQVTGLNSGTVTGLSSFYV